MIHCPPPQPFGDKWLPQQRTHTTAVDYDRSIIQRAKEHRWDCHWMRLAYDWQRMSKDPTTKVGCVIAKGKEQIATGYNGLPEDVDDDPIKLLDRDWKLARIVHAEMNALQRADFKECKGATVYLYGIAAAPCLQNCAKHLVNAKIARFIACAFDPVPERWQAEVTESEELFSEAGIELRVMPFSDLLE